MVGTSAAHVRSLIETVREVPTVNFFAALRRREISFSPGTNRQFHLFARRPHTRGETMRVLIAASALTLALLSTPSVAQTGSGRFCLKGPSGAAQCNFQTMAQCEQAKPAGSTSQCLDRSQVQGTTGSGAPSPGGSPMPPAGGTSPQR
jgi:Protein of unknown function (DUF3551)